MELATCENSCFTRQANQTVHIVAINPRFSHATIFSISYLMLMILLDSFPSLYHAAQSLQRWLC